MTIEEHAKLKLTLSDETAFEISEADIIQNSLTLSSQCVSGNTIDFGCVSTAQLSAKFRLSDSDVGRYDIYGAEITLFSWFGETQPEDGGQRGIFTVTAVSKSGDIFTVTASDNVCWLDKSAFSDDDSNIGNVIYNRLNKDGTSSWDALDVFNVIIGEIAELEYISLDKSKIPNAQKEFNNFGCSDGEPIRLVLLLDNEQSDNIRDYISWLAEYMGGFVTADEQGKISFQLFENAYQNSPLELSYTDFELNTLEIADFMIFLNHAKFITEDKTYNQCYYSEINDCTEEPENAIETSNVIQNNPFIEFIYQSRTDNTDMKPIVKALAAYQQWIRICPFSGTYHGEKYLHLGQYLKITDRNGNEHETTITNITWKFRGGQQIKCVGEDTRTLAQARKRTQAVRIGERMKTQINRLQSNLESEIASNQETTNTSLSGQWNTIQSQIGDQWDTIQSQISDLQSQIDELWNTLNGG